MLAVPTKCVIRLCWHFSSTDTTQVQNLSGCIKIAADFVDAASIDISVSTALRFQDERFDDVLHLNHVLYHAWHSILAQLHKRSVAIRNQRSIEEDNKLIRKGTVTREQLIASRVAHCPHPVCEGWHRGFTVPNVHKHL